MKEHPSTRHPPARRRYLVVTPPRQVCPLIEAFADYLPIPRLTECLRHNRAVMEQEARDEATAAHPPETPEAAADSAAAAAPPPATAPASAN